MSMSDISNLGDTIVPKSDQLNADQLLSGPITITITAVKRGNGDDQPVIIHYEGENGRPYKPCKSMRRLLVLAWGVNGADWIGRSMTLYNRPDVKFGGQEVGGIRISHLSHVKGDFRANLTVTRGKKEPVLVRLLTFPDGTAEVRASLRAAAAGGMEKLKAAWAALPKEHKTAIGPNGCPEDMKSIAREADEKRSAGSEDPAMTTAEVLSAIGSAADRDALDSAYDMLSLAQGVTEDDRKAVAAAYDARLAALEGGAA